MTDAAAFFANKKKKKKAFTFNANKIDAATIEKRVHVDAPALSSNNDATVGSFAVTDPAAAGADDAGEQWDDAALAATLGQKKAGPTSNVEVLDMKALDLKRTEQGDIQEKLRVEENKAKLAAAREGMEKEARRLKEQKEKKEQEGTNSTARFGAAAAGSGVANGGKWLPPHMRAGAGGASLSSRLGRSGPSSKFDTEDENLFPDLAAADAILEKQKAQGPAYKVPKKTPVGGGATWASAPKAHVKKTDETPSEAATQAVESTPAATEESKAVAPVAAPEASPAAATALASTSAGATATKAPIQPRKKKKKDLSTFKTGS